MIKTRTGFIVAALIVLVCMALLAPTRADDVLPVATETWTASFSKDIIWQKLTDAGFLIVCTSDSLYGVNPESGATAWTIEEFKGIPDYNVELVGGTQFAIITKITGFLGKNAEMVMIDVTNGKTQWTSKEVGIGNSRGQFLYPPSNALIIYGQKQDSDEMLTVMADLETGTPIWTSETLFEKSPEMFSNKKGRNSIVGNQPPVALPDGNFLEFWSKAGPRKIDAKTGKVLWTARIKVKEVPASRSGYASIQLSADSQIAYVPHDLAVDAIQVSDGKVLWKKGPKFKDKIVQMAFTPHGLVVRGDRKEIGTIQEFDHTTNTWKKTSLLDKDKTKQYSKPYLTVVDPLTGKPKWKKPFQKLWGSPSFVIQNDKVVIFPGPIDPNLRLFNIADGASIKLANKVKLKSDDYPDSLEIVGDNYLLMSSQSLLMLDSEGKEIYRNYHKSPGSAVMKMISRIGSGMSASTSFGMWNVMWDVKIEGAERSSTTDHAVMTKRFEALARAGNFATIQTSIETEGKTSPGLIKVDKTTGKDVKSVVLAKTNPEYMLDGIEGRLFLMKDDRTIVCYSF